MAIVTNHFTLFAVVFLVLAMLSGANMVSGQCQGNAQGLMEQCARYVQIQGPKMQPSQGCCAALRTVDLACVCRQITSEAEHMISMEKAVYIAQACGKPLAHGSRCGSYIVP